jgi:general secretion pathway protein J
MRREAAGFTLIELILALVLLGVMMLFVYSGLNFALRSWDAGDVNGRRVADWRISENFLQREVSEIYPMRFPEPSRPLFAFEGKPDLMRFVSSRRAGVSTMGLSLVSIEVDPGKEPRTRDLVMRRAQEVATMTDFSALDQPDTHATVLAPAVDSVRFQYFGSENNFTDPAWSDEWKYPSRMPVLVKMSIRMANGDELPDLVMRLMVGPEAGCFENVFQMDCRPKPKPTP